MLGHRGLALWGGKGELPEGRPLGLGVGPFGETQLLLRVLFPPCPVQPSLAGSSTSVVLPKSALNLSAGKTQTRGPDTRVQVATHEVFHIGETSPSSLSFPLKEKSQHGYLQRFIYYGTGVVQAWSQGRAEGGRAAGGQGEPGFPTVRPPKDIY